MNRGVLARLSNITLRFCLCKGESVPDKSDPDINTNTMWNSHRQYRKVVFNNLANTKLPQPPLCSFSTFGRKFWTFTRAFVKLLQFLQSPLLPPFVAAYLAFLGAYSDKPNMVKWGVPEKILQNAVQIRSIGPSSQKLWPNQIFGQFPHCNYSVTLE